jgi:sigma-B regulation protein RsbU (phosphoserine phosphatase)
MAESRQFSPLHCTDVGDSATSERVLIVDDEEPLAKVMARTLRSRGIESDIALNGEEARKLFEEHDYALVLLDVRLPDESGYGLLEELRSVRPDTAVVMISAVDDPELGRAALEHGAYGYVLKPVGATQLYLLAVNNLKRRALERDHEATVRRLESMVAERAEQMRKAAELQSGMLPPSPWKGDGFELAAHFVPAREISGDFYDWYGAADGRVAVALGDVMGKGLASALLMATARAALRATTSTDQMRVGMEQAAEAMSAALEVNHAYVTVFQCRFDPKSGDLEYIDAGHGHARLLRRTGSQEMLEARSAPIGVFPEAEFTVGSAKLQPGDTLVVFSDGLLDLRPDLATRDVQLPHEARRAASAQEVVDVLARGARDREVSDDVTVLALRRL